MRLINADALIEELEREVKLADDWKTAHEIVNVVKYFPNVEPKREGRWLWELADNGWADHICSSCGFKKNTDVHVTLGWRYCPMCGSYNGKE